MNNKITLTKEEIEKDIEYAFRHHEYFEINNACDLINSINKK